MDIHHSMIMPFALLVLLGVFMALRSMGGLPGMELAATRAKSARGSNKVSRCAEALMLLLAATAIFAFTATNTSTGGRLLTLDQHKFGFAVANVVVAVVIALTILLGVFASLKGLTSVGTIITIVALCSYGMLLNGPELLMESLAPEGSTTPPSTLTFTMYGTDAEDAELWVNGVRLGTLPYETTFQEFYENVSYWAEEPNELKSENRDAWLLVRDYRVPGGRGGSFENHWARIMLPKEPTAWNERDSAPHRSEKERTYYVRVKLADEWGYSTGGTGGSAGGGGRYNRRSPNSHFGFTFPGRQKQIETLLDIARAHDYQPGPDWFEAIETYNSDGWIALREAMDTEPEMLKLLDAWARWRYDLNEVTNAKSAWEKFEQICDEADRRRYYRTSGIAGRAIELITPELDPEQLVERAVKLIHSAQHLAWLTWEMNGRVQFGFTNLAQGMPTGASRHTWESSGGGKQGLPISGYAVAHAVWQLHQLLQAKETAGPNIVQERVVTEAVRWHPDRMRLLRIACYFGGHQLDTYLLRQNWRADLAELPWREQMRLGGGDVNGWLYLLTHLQSEEGREFRREHKRKVLDLLDTICKARVDSRRDVGRELGFVFGDLEAGRSCFAHQYWPRFHKYAQSPSNVSEPLQVQWAYLLEMEPVSTVEMYVAAWRENATASDSIYAVRLLEDLPDKKRRAVAQALLDYVEINGPPEFEQRKEDIEGRIKPYLEPGDKEQRLAREILEDIKGDQKRYTPDEVRQWLSEGKPGHPLVKMLAEEKNPQLRVLMMGAIPSHPTPANREILAKLLDDPDEAVRKAAQEARAHVEQLKSTPPMQLAHAERR